MADATSVLPPAGDIREVAIIAAKEANPLGDVSEGDTWAFRATGRWRDGFVPCGPGGRHFLPFDALAIAPRYRQAPWFSLMAAFADDPSAVFAIAEGGEITFERSGSLVAFANDKHGWYGNNHGALELLMSRLGRDEPPLPLPRDEGGWIHAWHAIRNVLDHAAGMGVIALLTLGVSYVLVFTTQGQDLSRGIGEDGLRQPGMIIFAALAAFLGGAGLDLGEADRRRLFRRRPGQMGAVAETRVSRVVAAAARRGAGFRSGAFALSPSRAAHRHCARDGRSRRAVHRRGLGPQASRAGVGRARVGAPPPHFEFTAPPYLGARKPRRGADRDDRRLLRACRLRTRARPPGRGFPRPRPHSAHRDHHHPGRRERAHSGRHRNARRRARLQPLGRQSCDRTPAAWASDRRASNQQRPSISAAFAAWKDEPKSEPETIFLVAAQGGASRAAYWTAAVLAHLNRFTGGQFARHVFAINSVSGGSVGSVGFVAALKAKPVATDYQGLLAFVGRATRWGRR